MPRSAAEYFWERKKQRMTPITPTALDWILKYLNHPERMLDTADHRAEADPAPNIFESLGQKAQPPIGGSKLCRISQVERPVRTDHPPYDPPYDRNSLAGTWNGPQNHSITARPYLSGNNDHLYACLIQTEARSLRQNPSAGEIASLNTLVINNLNIDHQLLTAQLRKRLFDN